LLNTTLKQTDKGFFSTNSRAVIIVTQFFEPNRLYLLQRAIVIKCFSFEQKMFEVSSTGIIQVSERKAFFTFTSNEAVNTAVESNAKILKALLAMTIIGYGLNIIRHVNV
jgi:hypothetical protein